MYQKINNQEIQKSVIELYNKGENLAQIGKAVGLCRNTVRKIVVLFCGYTCRKNYGKKIESEEPADAVEIDGFRLRPDCARRLVKIKILKGYYFGREFQNAIGNAVVMN